MLIRHPAARFFDALSHLYSVRSRQGLLKTAQNRSHFFACHYLGRRGLFFELGQGLAVDAPVISSGTFLQGLMDFSRASAHRQRNCLHISCQIYSKRTQSESTFCKRPLANEALIPELPSP